VQSHGNARPDFSAPIAPGAAADRAAERRERPSWRAARARSAAAADRALSAAQQLMHVSDRLRRRSGAPILSVHPLTQKGVLLLTCVR
jgi:hypothetical protein